jgi:D-3-phosphoglycerate dehydrogenase
MRVLVAEAVGDSGVELLRVAGLDVDLGVGWSREELEQRIGDYDGILIRSATKLDAGLIARAGNMRVIARAGRRRVGRRPRLGPQRDLDRRHGARRPPGGRR